MNNRVRVAVIGAGSMSFNYHLPTLRALPEVELAGIADLLPDKLQAAAAKFEIPATFSDYRRMIEETKPQAVFALLPPHVLYDAAMDVLEYGCDLFIEKPPALTAFQTACLARAAELRKLVTGVGFQRRFHPLFVRCRQEILNRGAVHQAVASYYKCMPPMDPHPYYRGAIDILTSDVIHAVDALRYYCGGEVTAVASDIRRIGPTAWYANCFNALIGFDNGATGILLANWRTGGRRLTLDLHGPDCSSFANADGLGEVFADGKPEPLLRLTHTEAAGSTDPVAHQGFLNQTRDFIDAVRLRCTPHNSLADATKTMQLVERIYANSITTPGGTP